MRLNQYLAACGLGSRRDCETLIAAGRVRVNGVPGHFGMRVDSSDTVALDGRTLAIEATGSVWLMHKPAHVLSAARDAEGRTTVLDVARRAGIATRVFSVGRLDYETTGLLLLTDDGDLAFALTHPSKGVEKEYEARIAAPLADAELECLATGIELEDGPTAPCQATQDIVAGQVTVRLVLHEGRKRQVRRMLTAVGAPVLALHRVRVGPVQLGDLAPGAVRRATPAEDAALRRTAGLAPDAGRDH